MPVLTESQIRAIAQAAEKLAKSLPLLDPKPMNTKKQICKEIEVSAFYITTWLNIGFNVWKWYFVFDQKRSLELLGDWQDS